MGHPLRMYGADDYYFVTARCTQGRLLLQPTERMAEVIGGVLARATRHAKVEVCGFVAASSHVHLLCRARDGELSKFMKYFLGNVSKKAGRLVDWTGHFWDRRFSASRVLDVEALEGILKYILGHGVKEGLVRRVDEWPGLSCLRQLLGESKRTFRFYEWAKRWSGGKLVPGGDRPWSEQWATDEELELHPLPHWERWTPEQRQARVRKMVSEIEEEGRKTFRTVTGRERVLATPAHTRPPKLERKPRPLVHASPLARRIYITSYKAFVRHFRAAVERLQRGATLKQAEFPPFSFVPCAPIRV